MLTKKQLQELKETLPKENILSQIEECYAYSTDASNPETISPADVVVFVHDIEQVQSVVKYASKNNLPIICRGAGTNTVGACVTSHGGIVLNFSKMNKILDINSKNMTARVQPGVVVGDLQTAAEKVGLFYPPDPSNLKVSTIGGSIAQNSAGARCFKYGATKDYVLELTVVMANGEVIKTGSQTIKNAVGYNLGSVFVGSEGTLGIVVEAVLKLIPKPNQKLVTMAFFESIEDAVSVVDEILSKKIMPSTIDFMDNMSIRTVEDYTKLGLPCDKDAVLVIEIDGNKAEIEYQQTEILTTLGSYNCTDIKISHNEQEYEEIWRARRSSMAACTKLKPNVTTDDVVVPRQNLAQLVRGVQRICKNKNLSLCMVGHVGDGNVHPQIPIDYNDKDECERLKFAKSEIYNLVIALDGTISGEHGIGLEKKEFASRVIDSGAIAYMRQIKQVFDPKNILNPYKIF